MYRWNNATGREIGQSSSSSQETAQRVFVALRRGDLIADPHNDSRDYYNGGYGGDGSNGGGYGGGSDAGSGGGGSGGGGSGGDGSGGDGCGGGGCGRAGPDRDGIDSGDCSWDGGFRAHSTAGTWGAIAHQSQ